MPRPRPLSALEAKRSLAHRLAGRVDRIRQLSTRFGLRSRRVFLVWTKFTGEERGEGREREVRRIEILPTPKVSELTSISFLAFAAGLLPQGSIRVENVSATFAAETLLGQLPPMADEVGGKIEEPFDFFYEVVEDQRESEEPARLKFRLYGQPSRDEGNVSWTLILERISQDRDPSGASRYLSGD